MGLFNKKKAEQDLRFTADDLKSRKIKPTDIFETERYKDIKGQILRNYYAGRHKMTLYPQHWYTYDSAAFFSPIELAVLDQLEREGFKIENISLDDEDDERVKISWE